MTKINGKKIAELRKNTGKSQKEFAVAVSTSQQMISFIELGTRQGKIDLLQRIAAYFNCSLDDLIINSQREDTA